MKRIDWEKSTGTSTYKNIEYGRTVTRSTYSRRLETNTDPLKNRDSAFGNGMKKCFVKISLGKHKKPFAA